MGFAEDIMRGFVSKEIRAKFPRYEGWDVQRVALSENQEFSFRVSRYHRGKNQYAFVSVSLKQKPTSQDIPDMKTDPPNRHTSVGRFLLIPQGADISGVPGHISVFQMSSFGFVDDELVWLTKKKNVMRYPVAEIAGA
jgi:hypothetical protein